MTSEEKEVGISSGVETGVDLEKKHVDPKIEKHSHDADEAMKALSALQGETIELDESTNRRLLKLIDWHMMPIMCVVYGMNYLDSMYMLLSLCFQMQGLHLVPNLCTFWNEDANA